jgi:hypothetical protein
MSDKSIVENNLETLILRGLRRWWGLGGERTREFGCGSGDEKD